MRCVDLAKCAVFMKALTVLIGLRERVVTLGSVTLP